MTFLFGTWPGRIVLFFGSIIILTVALGGVLVGPMTALPVVVLSS